MGKAWMAAAVLGLLGACATQPSVVRTDPQVLRERSGEWSARDSGETAEAMIRQCLDAAWLDVYRSLHPGRLPIVVVIDEIRNDTADHIDTRMFVKEIERALINSGRVGFVADPTQRQQLINEIKYQQRHASPSTAKDVGRVTGADFALMGSVRGIVDQGRRGESRYYQVDLELIEIETQRRVWVGTSKIAKEVTKARMRY